MKATEYTTLKRKAKDGTLITVTVSFVDYETGREWMIDFDDCFTYKTKAKAMENARNSLNNRVSDYEYDNNLI